ncbi:PEGA domain-containing protein [Patescibacteria group bacterium]|nr:PEGA domain-containing protein [Patescibacteria group bacterium]
MMKKTLVWFLVLISLAAILLRFSEKWTEIFFGIKQTSGISVLSEPSEATVYLDDKEVGKTPYENKNLESRDYTVKLQKERGLWEGRIKLTAGTVAVVNRDLAYDQASSAGEILTLGSGKGITIVSSPTDSDVEIDGKSYGRTPVTADIEKGAHTILISHTNYLKRSIRVELPQDFNLTVSVNLALSEADLTDISTPVITQTAEVFVKNTPTGFLRVREKPNLNGKEIGKVAPGDTLILLEEQGAWDRVRLSNGTEGYVSSSYVEKKNP